MTPAQRKQYNKEKSEYQKQFIAKKKANMTPAQRAEFNKKQSESVARSRAKRLANMTPAQRAEYNKEQSEYSKQWRKKNPERAKAQAYRSRNPTELYAVIACLLTNAAVRARKKGIPFNLSVDEAVHIYYSQNGKCYFTKEKMTMGTPNCPNKISPDQIIPGAGYTKENVQFVTSTVNKCRRNLYVEVFKELCNSVSRNSN